MKPSVRLRQLLALLEEREELTVEEACEHFDISPATARRDFVSLVGSGKADKTWGGIRQHSELSGYQIPSGLRLTLHSEEKRRIAAHAATMCADGSIVFIDGGTTTLGLARWFASRSLRIITNSVLVAAEIERARPGMGGADVFLSGGYLLPQSAQLVGPEATMGMSRYHADVVFLSAGGMNDEGVSNNHPLVVEVERVMIRNSKRVILLADSFKCGKRDLIPECSWDEVHALVTDAPPPPDMIKAVGDRLIIAEKSPLN